MGIKDVLNCQITNIKKKGAKSFFELFQVEKLRTIILNIAKLNKILVKTEIFDV